MENNRRKNFLFFLFPFLISKKGFTIIELLIFSAIFSLIVVSFITILVSFTRVQLSQSASSEVAQQSQFILQTVQYYVEKSSLVEMTSDSATSTLKLRMASSTEDPTYIYLSNNAVYLKQTDSGTPQQLTSSRVNVTGLTFTKRSNPPAHDSVAVSFTVAYNTTNPQQEFSQSLQSAVARVSAATFDSNILPASSSTYKIGAAAGDWQSINSTLYFSGSNVGIGASSPASVLEVAGDIYIDTTSNRLILRSSDGVCWKVSVSTSGSLQTTSSTCP